jgi:ketosteroid isomerase-like protein
MGMMASNPLIQWQSIIRGVAIVYGVTFVSGLVFAFCGIVPQTDHIIYPLLALLTDAAGVAIALRVAQTMRWPYLAALGVGVWLLSGTSVLVGVQTWTGWLESSAFTAATVILGRLLLGTSLEIFSIPHRPHSRITTKTMACVFALILIQGCMSKEELTDEGKTHEEALVEKTIVDIAHATTEFQKTKGPKSILRFYAQDYSGVNDGKLDSLKETQEYLSDVLERINLGAPIGISSKVTNMRANVVGPLGWATYDYEYKLGSSGVTLEATQGHCTTIFRKHEDLWLVQHEHCSTDSPSPFSM